MTNDSVRGYVILALKNLGKTKEEIDAVLSELHYAFDTTTTNEAEQYYYSGKWMYEED